MVILITGTSRGIGFELVKKCSQNKNNLIIALSRHIQPVEKLVKENELFNVLPITMDINIATHHKKLLQIIKKLELKVDVLINNAGQILNKPFEKTTAAELQAVYQTNLFAPFLLVQTLLPVMQSSPKSHVVNISSMGGFQGSAKFPGLSVYSSSKAALASLTECLAEELKTKNIAVNCLAIGAVQTDMLGKAFPGYKAPLKAKDMADYIYEFASKGHKLYNGKILPVSSSTP